MKKNEYTKNTAINKPLADTLIPKVNEFKYKTPIYNNMAKKYNLKCFSCRRTFLDKKEVNIINKKPYCDKCIIKQQPWNKELTEEDYQGQQYI